MKRKLSIVLILIFMTMSCQSAFAFSKTSNLGVKNSVQTEVNNYEFKINKITDSKYEIITRKDGHDYLTVIEKDDNYVYTKYYQDYKLILSDKKDLSVSISQGKEFIARNSSSSDSDYNASSVVVIDPEGGGSIPDGDYYFDLVVFSPKSRTQPYAHPDKEYYNISSYETKSISGLKNVFIQINQYDSNSVLQTPAWAVGGAIGALAVGVITNNLAASVLGAAIGGALGAYLGGQVGRIADEDGCIWFAIDDDIELKNLGSKWFPTWVYEVEYISLGPFSSTDYYIPLPK